MWHKHPVELQEMMRIWWSQERTLALTQGFLHRCDMVGQGEGTHKLTLNRFHQQVFGSFVSNLIIRCFFTVWPTGSRLALVGIGKNVVCLGGWLRATAINRNSVGLKFRSRWRFCHSALCRRRGNVPALEKLIPCSEDERLNVQLEGQAGLLLPSGRWCFTREF